MIEEYPAEGDKHTWSGPCQGGPLHNLEASSRFPKGFLLVDRPNNRVWIYDLMEEPTQVFFVVRNAEGAELVNDPEADKNRFRAADEAEFDIRVMDTEGWTG